MLPYAVGDATRAANRAACVSRSGHIRRNMYH